MTKERLLFISIIALLLTSCGARKVSKSETIIDSTSKTVAVIKTDSVVKESATTNYNIETDEITIEPIDSTKPIELIDSNGKVTKFKNARLSHKKKKDNTTHSEAKTIAKTTTKTIDNKVVLRKKETVKQIDKKQFDLFGYWWLWLLIIVAGYFGYRYIKYR